MKIKLISYSYKRLQQQQSNPHCKQKLPVLFVFVSNKFLSISHPIDYIKISLYLPSFKSSSVLHLNKSLNINKR